jgi:hypothetical protein
VRALIVVVIGVLGASLAIISGIGGLIALGRMHRQAPRNWYRFNIFTGRWQDEERDSPEKSADSPEKSADDKLSPS